MNEPWGLTKEEMEQIELETGYRCEYCRDAIRDAQLRKFRDRLYNYRYGTTLGDPNIGEVKVMFLIPERDWQELCSEPGREET